MRVTIAAIVTTLFLVLLSSVSAIDPMTQQIYVNRCADGPGDGSEARPYNTLVRAVDAAPAGSTLVVDTGSYPQPFEINRNLTIVARKGSALIGGSFGEFEPRCACGAKYQMCCPGAECDAGLSCQSGRCRPTPTPTPTPSPTSPTPPSSGSLTKEICSVDDVPEDWVVVDDKCDPTRCGGCNPAASGYGDVYVLQNTRNYSVGSTLDVCSISTIPSGWEIAVGGWGQKLFRWDAGKCGRPTSNTNNVATIKRKQ